MITRKKISVSSNQIIRVLAIVALLVAPWMLGGRINGSLLLLGGAGWSAFLIYIISGKRFRRFSLLADRVSGWQLLLGTCWLPFFVIIAISAFNPSHEAYLAGDGIMRLRERGAISFLPSCVYSWRTFQHGFFLSGTMLLACSAYCVFNQRRMILLLLTIVWGNGILLALLGIYFDAVGSELIFNHFRAANASFFSSFHYHNHWGVYALICLTSGIVVWDLKRGRQSGPQVLNRDVMFATFSTIIAFSIILAGGRLCLVALVFLLGFFVLRFIVVRSSSVFSRVSTLALVGALSVIFIWISGDNFTERFEQTSEQLEGAYRGDIADTRFYAAPRDTIRMALDNPIWGWGVGSYLYVFRDYAGEEFYIPHNGETVLVWMEAAHNDWLQLWAETGGVGAFLLLSGILVFCLYCVKHGRWNPFSSSFLVLFVLIGAIALLDFPMANPAIAIHIWVLGALVGKYAILEKKLDHQGEVSRFWLHHQIADLV